MDRLSSCYFCGDAVDAALEEYPLVDPERHPEIETSQRIVLCSSCRRKLTDVIERVLEAALNGETPELEEAESVAALGDDAELIDLDESIGQADNGEEMTATGVERVDDEDSGWAGEESDDRAGDEDSERVDDEDGERVENDDGERAYTSSTAARDLSAGDETADADRHDVDSDDADGDGTGGDDAEGDSTAGDDSETEIAGGETATAETENRTRAYTKSEYSKVVKLLQNRDFPVEIEEITVVARSAYGIDRETTHAILESLIDRGVLEDQGDRLVRA